MRIRAQHYATGQPVEILWEDGRILALGPPSAAPADAEAGWVAPALFDLQINGCDGRSFSGEKLTFEDVRHVVAVCRAHGIASLCPTLVTNSFEALTHGLGTLHQTCEQDRAVAHAGAGRHLERPDIPPDDGP